MSAVKVYIGWDGRDALAYEVCVASLLKHATIPLEILPLKEWELRRRGLYWRQYMCVNGTDDKFGVKHNGQRIDLADGKPFSTDFSFTRFCIPALEEYRDEWILFTDPDMMWRSDISKLVKQIDFDAEKSVYCVQHDHRPKEIEKMGGVMQTLYHRKNWSSLMFINPARCKALTPFMVNNQPGSWLHAMCWVQDDEIGALPASWNWLCGWSEGPAHLVHFTRGTPDMPGCDREPYAKEWRRYEAAVGGFFNGCQVGGSKRAR